jgi:hypothetical protein
VSNEPPGELRYSEDRKFYWDGARWIPMPQRRRWGRACLGVFLVLVILFMLLVLVRALAH